MSGGLFFRLASDNIKKNGKVYTPYILTAVGIMMMHYIITTLTLDDDIGSFMAGRTITLILRLGQIVIGVFAVIFLFYTSSFLMKRRKTELGLYSVLGMEKRHIAAVLAWESIIVWFRSTLIGIIGGILLGKLSETLLLRLIGGKINYDFDVSLKALLITAIFFAAVFAVIFVANAMSMARAGTIELLYSSAKGEKEPKANYALGIGGFVILIGGYYIAQCVESAIDAIVFFFLAVLLVIVGTFCVMIAGSVALLKILKKNKNYYYKTKHFVSTSSMIFRMKKHGAGLASICILSTMVLVILSSTACLYIGLDDMFDKVYPRDVQLSTALTETDRQTLDKTLAELLHIKDTVSVKNGFSAENEMSLVTCDFNAKIDGNRIAAGDFGEVAGTRITLMSLEDYNRSCGGGRSLGDDQVYIGCKGMNYANDEVRIGERVYQVKEKLRDLVMRGEDEASIDDVMYILLPKREAVEDIYKELCKELKADSRFVSLEAYVAFDTDKVLSESGKKEFFQNLQNDLHTLCDDRLYGENPNYETATLNIMVRTGEEENAFMEIYGGLFFLGILLSILFTGALIIIMYYKQVSEGYDDCERFEILRKVGMSIREIKSTINSQVLTMFFIPLVGAGVHMIFAFHILSLLIKALGVFNGELLVVISVSAFVLFAVMYAIAYKVTSGAYYKIVAHSEKLR